MGERCERCGRELDASSVFDFDGVCGECVDAEGETTCMVCGRVISKFDAQDFGDRCSSCFDRAVS